MVKDHIIHNYSALCALLVPTPLTSPDHQLDFGFVKNIWPTRSVWGFFSSLESILCAEQGPTGSRYPTRPELFFKYPTRPDPKIENDWVPGN